MQGKVKKMSVTPQLLEMANSSRREPIEMVRFGLGIVDRVARRLVKMSHTDRGRMEVLLLQLFSAGEEERAEIIDTLVEIILPDQSIGGLLEEKNVASREAVKKEAESRAFIGKQIREHRERLRMTQVTLAKKSGLPQSHISRLEKGMHCPTDLTIEKIAKALKVDPGRLDPGLS